MGPKRPPRLVPVVPSTLQAEVDPTPTNPEAWSTLYNTIIDQLQTVAHAGSIELPKVWVNTWGHIGASLERAKVDGRYCDGPYVKTCSSNAVSET